MHCGVAKRTGTGFCVPSEAVDTAARPRIVRAMEVGRVSPRRNSMGTVHDALAGHVKFEVRRDSPR